MVTLRLTLVLASLALPLVAAWWPAASLESIAFDARSAPGQLGGFLAVEDAPLEDDVLAMLQPETYLMRRYQRAGPEADPEAIWLYLAEYSGLGTTGAHDPAVCYPANGWDLQGLRDREIHLASGDRLIARLLLASQSGREELVLYWFQPVGRWPQSAPAEPLLRAWDRLQGRPQYVFVRLSTPLEEGRASGERALLELARELAPWLAGALRGGAQEGL